MKRSLTSFIISLCVISLCCIPAFAAGNSFSWYCVRNKDHLQPIADANMRFVEDHGGFYVDKNHGDDDSDKVIYLTFDAGYENGNVAKILDVLKEKKVGAAFFVLDNIIQKNSDLIFRMIDEGHLVCNHTSKHLDVTKCKTVDEFRAELEALERVYEQTTGMKMPKYFRPPEGKFSKQSMEFADSLGYKTIFWSFAYADWDNNSQPSHEAAKEKILSNHHNGEIMLLHPTSATNAAILGDVIDELRALGYRFGSLDELTNAKNS